MADRTVKVNLVADAKQYLAGIDEAVRKTREGSQSIEQRLEAQRQAFTMVGTAAIAVGALAAAGVVAATAAFSNFDAAMSNVQAATRSSASEMDSLRQAALDAGARTVYSATEAAGAIENLAKAGVSTADILGGALDGALDLAAADGMAVADAAEIAASAMTQFGLAGKDVTHIADLLAAGAGKAQGGVSDLGQALNQSGLVASQMGLSIEETVGSLTAFASAGLLGSDAGTSFRAMLLRLGNPTKESAQLMSDLGLSFYNAQGEFIGMEGVAGQLESRLSGLTQETRTAALATIFGQDAIRAASILYEEGASGIAEWTGAVDEQGYAAEQAAMRLDNLKGDLEALGGAFETLMIGLGASGDGPLRMLVQGLTEVVNWLGNLDPAAHAAIMAVMGLVAVIGTVGGAALVAVPQIAAFRTALGTLGITASSARASLAAAAAAAAPWAIAIGAVTLAVGALLEAQEKSKKSQAEWNALLIDGATATQLFRAAADSNGFLARDFQIDTAALEAIPSYLDLIAERSDNAWAALNPANIELDNSGFLQSLRIIDEQLSALASTDLSGAQASFRSLTEELDLSREEAAQLLDAMPALRDAFVEAGGEAVLATDGTVDAQKLLAVALGETETAAGAAATGIDGVASSTEGAAESAQALLDAQTKLVDAFFSAQDAASAYEQSVDDIAEAIAKGLSPAIDQATGDFDLGAQSGRDAAAMLQELVTNAQSASQAMAENGAATSDVAARQAVMRQQIYDTAIRMELSAQQAQAYADRLIAIPDDVRTSVTASTSSAQATIEQYMARFGTLAGTINYRANMPDLNGATSGSGRMGTFSVGGRIPGYAPGYDDRLGMVPGYGLIGLGGGEYIMPTLMTDRYLPILEAMREGRFPGYAGGGRVRQSHTYAAPSVTVQAPDVRFPSTMRATLDLGGGQLVDAVMRIADDRIATADRASARAVRQGI